jgi:hypothetical protein
MSVCPVCGSRFDDRGYQIVVAGVGTFDSLDCAEEGRRRYNRRLRELDFVLLDAARGEPATDRGGEAAEPRRLAEPPG